MLITNPLNKFEDYTNSLPDEVLSTQIFGKLGYLELCRTICSVSKRWYQIASQDILWSPGTVALEIPKKGIREGESKAKTIEKIILLKLLIKEAEPLLDKHVKTAEELIRAAYQIISNRSPSEEEKQSIWQLSDEISENPTVIEDIERGFDSHLLLRRIGLSDFASMEIYANKLQGCEVETAWRSVAYEHINENRIDEVIRILNLYLEDGYWPIIAKVVDDFCKNKQLDQAILFLEGRLAEFDPKELSKFPNPGRLGGVIEAILSCAVEKKRFDIYENLIIKHIHKEYQQHNFVNLIDELLKEKLHEKVKELIKTHSEVWEKNQDALESIRLIKIYVKTKHYNLAWRLALRTNEHEKKILDCLHRAFLNAEATEEAQKVTKYLDALNTG